MPKDVQAFNYRIRFLKSCAIKSLTYCLCIYINIRIKAHKVTKVIIYIVTLVIYCLTKLNVIIIKKYINFMMRRYRIIMYRNFFICFRYIILTFILLSIYYFYNNSTKLLIFLLMTFVLLINDTIRLFKLTKNKNSLYSISLFFTIILSSFLYYFLMTPEVISYLIINLLEIVELQGIKLKIFLFIHSFLYMILVILNIGIPNNFYKISIIIGVAISYLAIAYGSYLVIAVKRDKKKINTLYENLRLANLKLLEYSSKVEELTICNERAQIAQELHDSIGHSLMALSMHLDYAKNIHYENPDKLFEVLTRCEEITKLSIVDLRKSVCILKESSEIKCFNESIINMINTFNIFNNIKFNFSSFKGISSLSPIIKKSIYITIKEFITNCVKHGKSTEININISKSEDNLYLNLSNNGKKCKKIIKSNGLIGIQDRINSLCGTVNYDLNNKNYGFCMNITIPIQIRDEDISKSPA